MQSTSVSLITNIINEDVKKLNSEIPVKIVYKDGWDTAGSQTVWKSASMKEASDHIFQYGLVPLRVEQEDDYLEKPFS